MFNIKKSFGGYLPYCLLAAILSAAFFLFCSEKTPDNCGDGQPYNKHTQFCYAGATYNKCGSDDYDPSAVFCDNVSNTTYPLCGGNDYFIATQFCSNNVVHNKCAGQEYNTSTMFCANNVTYQRCGGNEYDPATQFCLVDIAYDKCAGQEYDPTTHGCVNNGHL